MSGPEGETRSAAPESSAALASGSPELVRVVVGLASVRDGMKLWGPAFTVQGRSGDNLALHRALASASRGDVIVAQLTGEDGCGHWGELMTIAAQVAGLAGLVVDGAIRDKTLIAARGFPVFHRGTHPSSATKAFPGGLQVPVTMCGIEVSPGDGVFADDDGIVVVPREHLDVAETAARAVVARELGIASRLAAGESTIEVLGLG